MSDQDNQEPVHPIQHGSMEELPAAATPVDEKEKSAGAASTSVIRKKPVKVKRITDILQFGDRGRRHALPLDDVEHVNFIGLPRYEKVVLWHPYGNIELTRESVGVAASISYGFEADSTYPYPLMWKALCLAVLLLDTKLDGLRLEFPTWKQESQHWCKAKARVPSNVTGGEIRTQFHHVMLRLIDNARRLLVQAATEVTYHPSLEEH